MATTDSTEQNLMSAEYVDKVKNYYGNVSYYCNLCGLQFSEKLMLLHCKGKAHENFLKVVRERDTDSDKVINTKHDELIQTKEEFEKIAKLVLDCEESLKLVSDDILNSEPEQMTNGSSDMGEGQQKLRSMFGVMRTGILAKGLLMRNIDHSVELVALCCVKPTLKLLTQVSQLMTAKLQLVAENAYDVDSVPDEACIFVRARNPNATCKISITSALMRPHPFEYYNAELPADPEGMLPRDKCIDALRETRRARWFEAKLYNLQHSGLVLRILRDLCIRDPHWGSIDFWILEILVERSLTVAESQLSPSLSLRTVMELIASGILIGDQIPGLYDPCERLPTDLLAGVDHQLLEHVTRKAQKAVRLIAFGQVDQFLSGTGQEGKMISAAKLEAGGVLKRSNDRIDVNQTDVVKKRR